MRFCNDFLSSFKITTESSTQEISPKTKSEIKIGSKKVGQKNVKKIKDRNHSKSFKQNSDYQYSQNVQSTIVGKNKTLAKENLGSKKRNEKPKKGGVNKIKTETNQDLQENGVIRLSEFLTLFVIGRFFRLEVIHLVLLLKPEFINPDQLINCYIRKHNYF